VTVLVALTPGERGTAALHLGNLLARSAGDSLVVAAVVPTPWPPSPFPGEAEYLQQAERSAEQALARARAQLGGGLPAEFVVQHGRSVAAGLLEVTIEHRADLVVLGSSSDGLLGRVGLGAVAHRLLHSTDVPVVLAPRGFTADGIRVRRVTAAFGPRDAESDLVRRALRVADGLGATLRVATFAVRPPTGLSGTIEESADDLVVARWSTQVAAMVTASLGEEAAGAVATRMETVVGQGNTWAEAVGAVPWAAGDLLVVGTSSSAISSFLLGSHAAKVVRSSPVPVYLVPRALHG
jgi:nucleotide-binding universal stress UspA family protein